jgi:HAD superfamily hydrolase (TIGR01509 family)
MLASAMAGVSVCVSRGTLHSRPFRRAERAKKTLATQPRATSDGISRQSPWLVPRRSPVLSADARPHPPLPALPQIPDMNTMTPNYRAVLVDIDGTLIDSNDAHARAWLEALRAHGHDVPYDGMRRLIGMGGDKVLPIVAGVDESSSHGRAILHAKKQAFAKLLPGLKPTRGARHLLEHLHVRGLMLLVATSAEPDEASALLRAAGVDDLVVANTGEPDGDSKPDPDVLNAALRRAGLLPFQAIVIGDTPYDVEAGRRAHVPVIALRCGGYWSDGALSGAVRIYDDPQALLERINGSPLAPPKRSRPPIVV